MRSTYHHIVKTLTLSLRDAIKVFRERDVTSFSLCLKVFPVVVFSRVDYRRQGQRQEDQVESVSRNEERDNGGYFFSHYNLSSGSYQSHLMSEDV